MKSWCRLLLLVAMLWFAASAQAASERLVVDFMISSGIERSAWVKVLSEFEKANPDVEVIHNEFNNTTYRRDFERRLSTEKIDIAFWVAGEQLNQMVARGLVLPMDGEFAKSEIRNIFTRASYDSVIVDGRAYGLPISYYPWGFFYQRSVFKQLGLSAPVDWAGFLKICETLRAAGIDPIAIGGKDAMSLAAWFDYLDLRINGLDFHQKLLLGKIAFSDVGVRDVFGVWRSFLEQHYFMADTNQLDWSGVLPYFYRSKVGMVLMGSFVLQKFPAALRDDIGFFPFPRYRNDMASYEDAPLDILVMPRRGENKKAAQRFLSFLEKSNVLDEFNNATGTISPRINAVANGPFLRDSKKLLDNTPGIAFFFDRDAKDYLIQPSFDAFKMFVMPPYDASVAIAHIERAAK